MKNKQCLCCNSPFLIPGVSLELSDREKFSNIQGEVLVQISGFPLCSIHFQFSLSSKQGEVRQILKGDFFSQIAL